jgi:hypothetical protein
MKASKNLKRNFVHSRVELDSRVDMILGEFAAVAGEITRYALGVATMVVLVGSTIAFSRAQDRIEGRRPGKSIDKPAHPFSPAKSPRNVASGLQ